MISSYFAGLLLVQVQQVPLNLSIFGKGTIEVEIAKRIIIESVNFKDLNTLEPVICRTEQQPCFVFASHVFAAHVLATGVFVADVFAAVAFAAVAFAACVFVARVYVAGVSVVKISATKMPATRTPADAGRKDTGCKDKYDEIKILSLF